MAYKQKGFSAHDNMRTKPKDLSGRTSAKQRTPQIKPSSSPGKLRYAQSSPGIDEVWNANSDIKTGMGNLGNLSQNVFMNQETSGFVNNPMISSSAGEVNQHGQYGDFYNAGKATSSGPKSVFNSKAAMELAQGGGRTRAGGTLQRDTSEVGAKSGKSIMSMINSSISDAQATQDAKRAAGLKTYKANAAAAAAARQAENNKRFETYKASQTSKYNKLQNDYNKMSDAQKKAAAAAAAAKARPSRRRRSGLGGVVSGVGKAVGGVGKAVGGVAKGIGRAIGGIFGRRRRRRRRRRSSPKSAAQRKAYASVGSAMGIGMTNRSGQKKVTPTKKAPARRRRRRRRRWFSDVRLKHNIMRVGSSKSGIPIYNFSYIGYNTIYQGAMAQDLISMGYNDAITIDNKSGYYMVDYDQIDIDMITI